MKYKNLALHYNPECGNCEYMLRAFATTNLHFELVNTQEGKCCSVSWNSDDMRERCAVNYDYGLEEDIQVRYLQEKE